MYMQTLGIHINLTSPSRGKIEGEKKYKQNDYDLVTTILSALKWKEKNGKIKLYTDIAGFNYYKENKLLDLWDGGVDIFSNDEISSDIDTESFWAIGKIYAIKKQTGSFCVIDTDIIVWENISEYFKDKDVVCVHRESISFNNTYRPLSYYQMKDGYVFDPDWGYKEDACNTAIIYFNNDDFKNKYCEQSIHFAENCIPSKETLYLEIVFAEQRILPMFAKKYGVEIHSIFNTYFPSNQNVVTHVWGLKYSIKNNTILKDNFIERCLMRIIVDYPEWKERLLCIEQFSPYYGYIEGFEI